MDNRNTLLILGAGSDIAKAIARKFSERHYAIQLAGRDQDQMIRLKFDLEARYDAKVSVHPFDATDYESHDDFISSLPSLPDVIIYTAGYMTDQKGAALNWELAQNTIEVNYSGAVSIFNRFALKLSERGSGCMVGISSVAGERGRGSNFIYGSTKAAFSAYLSGLRNELFKKGIQVITVKPGFVYTKMTSHLVLPVMLTAQPDHVASRIFTAVSKKKDIIYITAVWRWIMLIIKMIPEPAFKRISL